jgi:uncharacterized membrane protein
MSEAYAWLRLLHVLSATVLFGTGLGTAFQMWAAHRGGEPRAIATVARNVVLADFLFTTPAAIVQPASGLVLVWLAGIDPSSSWLVAVYVLYALIGACWLPVVWLQIGVRDLARDAAATGAKLPAEYHRRMTLWFALGWPAFLAMIAIFWLMVNRPDLW